MHLTSQVFGALMGTQKTRVKPRSVLDLQLSGSSGRARLAFLGKESEAIRTGSTIYVKASPAFYKRLARRTGAHLAEGTWIKAPTNNTQLAQFTALTEPGGELTLLLRNPTLSLTKGQTTTIDGHKAIELKTKGKLYNGSIYVAATGTPYPLKIVKHGHENATTTFTSWNDPITLTPPADTVEISKLEHRGP